MHLRGGRQQDAPVQAALRLRRRRQGEPPKAPLAPGRDPPPVPGRPGRRGRLRQTGQGGADVGGEHAPAAHIHLRARRLPRPVQRRHHGSRPSQNEAMEEVGVGDGLAGVSVANDPSRSRLTHQTTFVRRHLGLSSTPGVRWVVAFFRQFFGSVTKVDYLTLRQGFINAHLSQKSRFDFHRYIKRSLEDDFKVVVGISLKLWFVAVLILFLDFHGIGTLVWMSVVPLVILLWVGTKLEMVIMEMAQEIQDRESVVKGAPVVQPSNKYFWFDRPDWVLFLIHLTLFQNAFQMAHFVWTVVGTPGLKKCYHQKMGVSIAKVVLGVAAQIMCSYITFPLYALVTQMGSHMKRSVFNEQTAKALTNWRKVAKEKKKARDAGMLMAQIGGDATPGVGSSPVHLLHNAGARSDDPESVPASPRAEKEGGGVQRPAAALPVRRVPPCDGWRSASLPALDAHVPGADFCFSTQR
ncbi:MLO protein homolog 1 isoform X1 [Triticum aestivum]|uniref:MLO protein homolog 1 isoform X1 n=1 Tax=Triticum aestivum TaxID=4565 RepID=UPI001D013BE4|nr:MLO protein homolog 1-like isoform X1 [Triticum aestivum]